MGAIALALLERYLPYIIGVIAIVSTLIFLHHKIYTEGREYERALWIERDAETERKSQELLKLKNHEFELAKTEQDQRYKGALNDYASYINTLTADRNKRVQVSTSASNCSRNAVPTAAGNTESATGASEETLRSLKAVEIIIEQLCVPNMIIK